MSGDQLATWQIYILITSGIWSCIMLCFLGKPNNVFTQLWSDREKKGGGGWDGGNDWSMFFVKGNIPYL